MRAHIRTTAEAAKLLCLFMQYCTNEASVVQYFAPAIMAHSTCQTTKCMAWVEDHKIGFCQLMHKP